MLSDRPAPREAERHPDERHHGHAVPEVHREQVLDEGELMSSVAIECQRDEPARHQKHARGGEQPLESDPRRIVGVRGNSACTTDGSFGRREGLEGNGRFEGRGRVR